MMIINEFQVHTQYAVMEGFPGSQLMCPVSQPYRLFEKRPSVGENYRCRCWTHFPLLLSSYLIIKFWHCAKEQRKISAGARFVILTFRR